MKSLRQKKPLLIKYTLVFFIVMFFLFSFLFLTKDEYKKLLVKEEFTRDKRFENDKVLRFYSLDNEAVQIVKSQGYEGEIILLVSIIDNEIKEVKVLEHQETEDYGDYLDEKWFLDRLKVSTKTDLKVVKIIKEQENEIVAITGATITTRSVVDALNECIENYRGFINEN